MEKVLRYKNGLRAIVKGYEGVHSVAMGIWVNAGSRKETEENNGISHFIEHMMFKGTDQMNAFEIAKNFEDMGAAFNAFTSKDCTCYFLKCIDSETEKAFSLLSHIFTDSTFPPEEMERERKVIIEEINMTEDSPEDVCFDMLAAATYEGSLSRPIIGNIANVSRFNGKDIQDYMSLHYCPDNIVVAFTGAIDPETADSLIQKYMLQKLQSTKGCQKAEKNTYKSEINVRIDDYEQSNLMLSYPSIPLGDNRWADQAILNVILGGGMSSRLFQKVREEMGLAYSIYTNPSVYFDAGSFNICVNYTATNTGKILSAIKGELDSLLKDGISKEEFSRAIIQLKTNLIFSEESIQTQMLGFGKLLLLKDEVYSIEKKIEELKNATTNGVMAFARTVLSQKPSISYLGRSPDVDIQF